MAGRPRSFDRSAAIDRFVEVFWAQGYSATSVDDLQAAVGIKRSSFYAAFIDKETAYRLAFARYLETVAVDAFDVLALPAGDRAGLAAFVRFVGRFLAAHRGRGCFMLSAVADPPLVDDAEALDELRVELRQRIAAQVKAIAKRRELKTGETAQKLEAYVLAVVLGLNGMARANESARAIRDAADLAARFLEASL